MDEVNNVINQTLITAIGDVPWRPFPFEQRTELSFSWLIACPAFLATNAERFHQHLVDLEIMMES